MKMQAARRVAGLERTLIRRIFDGAPSGAINLGLGQPDLPTPAAICLEGVAGIARGETRYTATAGTARLREAIAERYAPFSSGLDNVLVTVGSQEAMYTACMTLLDPGDELLYPDPGYPGYPKVAELVGARGVPYPLRADNGFRIVVPEIEQRINERTRAVVLCEPSNPTGAISDRDTLAELAALLERRGIPWISDEIYSGFAYDAPFVSISELAPSGGLVISGLSKDLSMTGWRIGWIVGPPSIITRATAVHQYLLTTASSVSQAAAVAAFGEAGRAAARRYLEIFRSRRSLVERELSAIPDLSFAVPDGAFYFFVDISRYGDALELSRRILERRNVIVIPGVAFGEGGEGFLRISFAAATEDLQTGIRRIGEELRDS